MSVNNKLIDIEKLSRYHENLKVVLNTKEAAGEAAKAEAAAKKYADEEIAKLSFDEAGAAAAAAATAEQNAKDFATGLVMDGEKVRFDEAGSAAEAYDAAKEYADDLVKNEDGSVKFDDKGAAATAEQNAKDFATGLVMDGEKVRFDAAGSAAAAQSAAESYADGLATNYDAAGSASTAEQNAKTYAKDYADGLATNYDAAGTAAGFNTAMDERVVKLEAIDHDKLVADAIAAVVAGAESDFDTLKEVADWINSDTTGAAALQIKVAENADAITDLTNDKQDNITDLETIRTGAAAGAVAEQNAKDFATGLVMDGEKVRFDAAGSAADALDDAKEYADDLVMNEDGSVKFDDKGAAAQALADAKADAAGLYQVKGDYLIPSDLSFATDGDIDGLFA